MTMAPVKYDITQGIIVRHEGKVYPLKAGTKQDIPSEIINHFIVKDAIKTGVISTHGAKKVAAKDQPTPQSETMRKVQAEAKIMADKIVAAAKEEADKIVAVAKEEAEMFGMAAEEEAKKKITASEEEAAKIIAAAHDEAKNRSKKVKE
jgi:vacuolar-type H+-ATPase subunit H